MTTRRTDCSPPDGRVDRRVQWSNLSQGFRVSPQSGGQAGICRHQLLLPHGPSQKLGDEVNDPEASDNDRFVIYTHLQNAVVCAAGQLPSCQDTGTAIVMGKKGQFVLTDFDEVAALSEGIYETYQEKNLRYSQLAPLEMFKEKKYREQLAGADRHPGHRGR